MSAFQKLTKKQKKALAFRERKQGKGKPRDADEDNAIPINESQDLPWISLDEVETQKLEERESGKKRGSREAKGKEEGKSKGKGRVEKEEAGEGEREEEEEEREKQRKVVGSVATRVVDAAPKRKRQDIGQGSEIEQEEPKRKRKRELSGDDQGVIKTGEKPLNQRFILFVGNLKYTTSIEAIREHFASCDPPPLIRLLTPKTTPSKVPKTHKSKGCAFLEFSHRNALQQGLKLHQSELEGRRINVELTAGGGGKSEKRLTKLTERNRMLHDQRRKRSEKTATMEESKPIHRDTEMQLARPQRYSTTSGLEQQSAGKRTWTVADAEDEKKRRTHKNAGNDKKRGLHKKEWATGVNAIAVG